VLILLTQAINLIEDLLIRNKFYTDHFFLKILPLSFLLFLKPDIEITVNTAIRVFEIDETPFALMVLRLDFSIGDFEQIFQLERIPILNDHFLNGFFMCF